MQVEERRANKRFLHKRPIPFINMGDSERYSNERSGKIELVDLSDGGLKLSIEGLFPLEDAIMQVRIPMKGLLVTLPVFTQIKWTKKVQPNLYNIGLQFLV